MSFSIPKARRIIRQQKAIITKRNKLFIRLRRHYENTTTALWLMMQLVELKAQWKEQELELMDFIIMQAMQYKNMFYREDVEKVILDHPAFYEHSRVGPTGCINRLIRKDYIRKYSRRKQETFIMSTAGRVFIANTGKQIFKIIRGSLK